MVMKIMKVMCKLKTGLFSLAFILAMLFAIKPVHADQTTRPTLLVYDSENVANGDEAKIDSLQRLLVSLNQPVKIMSMAQYQQGDLNDQNYSALILMINWPQAHLIKQTFINDMQNFHGKILHIGPSLTDFEKSQLQGDTQYLRHQQYFLYNQQYKYYQMLNFVNSAQFVVKPAANSQTFGELATQGNNQSAVPYGVIHNNMAFLPYFKTDGLSFLEASQLMAQFFGQASKIYHPLLVIKNVTPFSNLKQLVAVADYLHDEGISFAISATSVAVNTNLKAFQYYALALQYVENDGGNIFLQVPEVYVADKTKTAFTTLRTDMTQTLTALCNNYVYPVGLSAPSYWNQDGVYQSAALGLTNQVLLTANTDVQPPYINQDNYGMTYGRTYYEMPLSSLHTIKGGSEYVRSQLHFAVPTAVTVSLPTTKKAFVQFKRNLNVIPLAWLNLSNDDFKSNTKVGSKDVSFQLGNYFINNEMVNVPLATAKVNNSYKHQVTRGTLSGFFNINGIILEVFIFISMAILILLFIIGYRVYLGMFKRSVKKEDKRMLFDLHFDKLKRKNKKEDK